MQLLGCLAPAGESTAAVGEARRGGERRGEAVTGLGQHGDGSRRNASEGC